MKKLVKVLSILIAIAAALAGIYLLLKKLGIISDCDCDCSNCDCDCSCKDEDAEDDDDDEEEDSFDSRGYVSINPVKECSDNEDASEEETEETEE